MLSQNFARTNTLALSSHLPAHTTYEDGSDRVLRNVGTKIQTPVYHPKERIQQTEDCLRARHEGM